MCGRADMTKLIVVFCSSAKAPKNWQQLVRTSNNRGYCNGKVMGVNLELAAGSDSS
jgi:hypothetical protein